MTRHAVGRWACGRPLRRRAFEQDAGRLSLAGRSAIAQARDEFERDGIPFERLRACRDGHESGTSLPGCLKVYVPDWHGRWRMIFQISIGDEGAVLVYAELRERRCQALVVGRVGVGHEIEIARRADNAVRAGGKPADDHVANICRVERRDDPLGLNRTSALPATVREP